MRFLEGLLLGIFLAIIIPLAAVMGVVGALILFVFGLFFEGLPQILGATDERV